MHAAHLIRHSVLVLAVTLLASTLVTAVTDTAHADTGCPTATSPTVNGSGIRLISTAAELQYVRENSWLWASNFQVTSNIDIQGCVWSAGIGSGVGSGFSGIFDGDGHVISGLSISSNEQQVGLFTRIDGGTVRDLGFTGSVTSTYSGSGDRTSSVGALAGTVATGATIERVFTTGDVSAVVTMSESCTMMCRASATATVGGLVGRWDGGSLTNSFATGDATAQASAFSASSGYVNARAEAGGLVGSVPGGGLTLATNYATGVPTATATAPGGTSNPLAGGVTSESASAFTGTYWNTTTSSTSTGIAAGSNTATVTGLTSTQMRSSGSFSGWNIASGYDASKTWGLCSTVNDGFPFLTAFYATNPCSAAPTVTAIAPTTGSSSGGTSVVITGTDLTGATAVTFGGVNATSYTVDSATQITAVTPAGTPGSLADVVVTTPGGSHTSPGAFTYNRLSQTVTWSPTTSVLTTQSPLTPSTAASALGGAAISYSVRPGATTTCTVNSSTGELNFTGAGSCTIRALAAYTSTYNPGFTDVTFTVTDPSSNSGGGGSSSGGGASNGSTETSSVISPANSPTQVSVLPPIVPTQPASVPALNQTTATINGVQQPARAVQNGNRLTIRVDGTGVVLILDQAPEPTTYFAQGFQPGSPVSIYAMSTPTLVATATTDAGGEVKGLITLPRSLGAGRHTLVVSGYMSNGDALSVYTGVSTQRSSANVVRRIYFDVGSADLTMKMRDRLSSLARSVKSRQPTTVTVGVVRASNASPADRALALKRARVVNAHLRNVGMPGTLRIGASIPTTAETWQARRVVVTVSFG